MKFAGDAARVTIHQARRAAPYKGTLGTFDTASKVESATDSGYWIANGTVNYASADGLHQTQAGYMLEKNGNAITPGSITR